MTDKLYISYHDSIYVKLDCEDWMLRDIQDRYTFMVPGYQFMPKYRDKLWDGKVRLISTYSRTLYTGLCADLCRYARQRGYEVHLDPKVAVGFTRALASGILEDYVAKIGLPPNITVRDYQFSAFKHSILSKRAVNLSSTGSGKSMMLYLISRYLSEQDQKKVLIVVPQISLVTQMANDFASYSTHNGWKADENIYKIYGGVDKRIVDKPITITTWQSIYKMPAAWFAQFDALICDEVHLFNAQCTKGILEKCPAEYRLGFTGTLDDMKVHELVLRGLLGPIKRHTETKDLIDRKILADLTITAIGLEYPKEIVPRGKLSYKDEMDYLVNSKEREEFLLKLALNTKGNTLVLFSFVEKHAKVFSERLSELAAGHKKKVFLFTGDTKPEDRERMLIEIAQTDDAIINASFGVFSTGMNVPNLRNLIYGSPTKSKIRNLQSLGRVLRRTNEKDSANLFDIVDDLTYGRAKDNFALSHFKSRYENYIKEGFTVNLHQYKINPILQNSL